MQPLATGFLQNLLDRTRKEGLCGGKMQALPAPHRSCFTQVAPMMSI